MNLVVKVIFVLEKLSKKHVLDYRSPAALIITSGSSSGLWTLMSKVIQHSHFPAMLVSGLLVTIPSDQI